MTKKITMITLITMLTLSLGYVGFYQWAKSRFLDNHQAIVKTLEKDGFTIEQNTPIIFSGFPFKIIAHQEKFTAIRASDKISSTDTHITVSMLNPLELDIKGNTQIQGISTPSMFPQVSGLLTKKEVNFNIGAEFNSKHYTIKYDIKAPHMVLIFDSSPDSILLKSIKLYNFEALSDNTKFKDINFKISGETAEYEYRPIPANTPDGIYKLTFENVKVITNDNKTKWEGSLSIPHWSLKFDIKKVDLFQKYWSSVITKGMEDSGKYNGSFSKLSPEKQVCILAPILLKPLYLLNEPDVFLEMESSLKRGSEILDFKATLFKKGRDLKLKCYVKSHKMYVFLLDLINILAQPPAELFNTIRQEALKSENEKAPFEKEGEVDVIEKLVPAVSAFCQNQ